MSRLIGKGWVHVENFTKFDHEGPQEGVIQKLLKIFNM